MIFARNMVLLKNCNRSTGRPYLGTGLAAKVRFDTALCKTVQWYVENESWWRPIVATPHALDRIGLGRSGPFTLQPA